MAGFPDIKTWDAFSLWRDNPDNWLAEIRDIARAHHVPHSRAERFNTGTNLVVALGRDHILKVFPPILRHQFIAERASLHQLSGRLDVGIQSIVAEGERDTWPYLVLTRLEGHLGQDAWPGLLERQKGSILQQIGETIRQVEAAPLGELSGLTPDWPTLMERQIRDCRDRHIRLGLPEKFWDELDELIGSASSIIPMNPPRVILTGEYIPENFVMLPHQDGWRLSGLFDFGDVMTGLGEYDLLGPSAFMSAGSPGRIASLFKGFGYTGADITPALKKRLLTLMFLHRASDPLRHIRIEGWQHKVGTLGDLKDLLWSPSL
ncbi:aminoglycoside phosphotransferase family protein [Lichenifustis flavocetrariae]|uniref:Aminoglycoside 3'-phosphotransferase/choline kinase family protein n=1 Tax=Lichenifustis flavocetrariae TaxID=2949735 RepID=A0AA41YTX2_9HYPH|nr:aminoglycoside 3'-phosphotransferase/choline kinase family protein [Lichenifustis flavocetrariae]MCW6507151.1 aminoglycoside 3'-phosphotransferase/choline kinase family protein [Lichenifustis flavocetrariae]